MTEEMKNIISREIKVARTRAGFSQIKVAKSLNLSYSTYLKYENNPEFFKASVLIKLSDLLKCNVFEFYAPIFFGK